MRTLTRLLAAIAAAATLAVLPSTAGAVEPSTASPSAVGYGVPDHQRITFVVDGCDRCTMTLAAFDRHRSWHSRSQRVGADGRVTYTVPQRWVDGVSASLTAPWERRLGYVSQVVFRYGSGQRLGDRVTVAEARKQDRGSVCLHADPSQTASTIPLTIRKVRVEGIGGRTNGTLAFATRTQRRAPMSQVFNGVGGAQDVPPCQY